MMTRLDEDFKAVLDVFKREFPSLVVYVEGVSPDRFICMTPRQNYLNNTHFHWWETGWHPEDDDVMEWVEGLSGGLRQRIEDAMRPHIVRKRMEGA